MGINISAKTIGVFLIVLALQIGCKNSDDKVQVISVNDFIESDTLYGTRLPTKEVLNVRYMFVQDSFLVIRNSRNDSLFMVFNLDSMRCIKSWGEIGRGPEEYGTFTHLLPFAQNTFQVADFSRMIIQSYSIPGFNLKNEVSIVNNCDKPDRQIPQNIVTSNGSEYYYDNYFRDILTLTVWKNNLEPIVINTFESLKEQHTSSVSYLGNIAINSDLNRLIYAYRYLKRIDIMDMQGKLIKTIKITPAISSPVESGTNFDFDNSVITYSNVRSFGDSFFVFYVGFSGHDLSYQEYQYKFYIEEFDWDGNPKKRYEVDRYLSEFDIKKNSEGKIQFIGIDKKGHHQLMIYEEI